MSVESTKALQCIALPSEHYEERDGHEVDVIVLHSMYVPHSDSNRFDPYACKECLDSYGVSAHYLIDRQGLLYALVSEDKKAWHAGVSTMPFDGDSRTGVNAFSIGVELIGSEDSGFTDNQYSALAHSVGDMCQRHPLRHIVGHGDIAPERKTDPWNFDWSAFAKRLNAAGLGHLKLRGRACSDFDC